MLTEIDLSLRQISARKRGASGQPSQAPVESQIHYPGTPLLIAARKLNVRG